MNPPVMTTSLAGLGPRHQGKVRDIYDLGDKLLLVATDRISAFDVVMAEPIPDKGRILTRLSAFWFRHLADLTPNHLVSLTVEEFPPACLPFKDLLEGRTMLVRKCKPLPVECIVRGYLSGSGWAEYRQTGAIGGLALPPGLVESQKLPEPIFTPSTKAELGTHDENIDFATMAGISRNLDQAAARLALAQLRIVDVGTAHYRVGDAWFDRYFNNNMGVGLEAAVILESNKILKLRGMLLYATAAVRALIKQKSPYMNISWELEDGEVVDYDKHTLMVSVGNSPRAGGGFYLTPDAKMDDHFLDVAIAKDISRPAVLALLPRAMFGKHTGHHAVTMLRVQALTIAI
ncbi:MAG: phosphoribosylaminoimidazolesuccinocarboxamide synthase, partial [Deltaproteobacteria bacterium]|nr:phosphoribosylaminoimidazolesuccinocarboxamide synthase [Deltaproteobacteria bacterium]